VLGWERERQREEGRHSKQCFFLLSCLFHFIFSKLRAWKQGFSSSLSVRVRGSAGAECYGMLGGLGVKFLCCSLVCSLGFLEIDVKVAKSLRGGVVRTLREADLLSCPPCCNTTAGDEMVERFH